MFFGSINWKTTQSWLNTASFSLKSVVQRHLSVFITWCLRNHQMRHKSLTTTSHTSAVLTCWEVSFSLDTPSSFGFSCQVTKIVLVKELYFLHFNFRWPWMILRVSFISNFLFRLKGTTINVLKNEEQRSKLGSTLKRPFCYWSLDSYRILQGMTLVLQFN